MDAAVPRGSVSQTVPPMPMPWPAASEGIIASGGQSTAAAQVSWGQRKPAFSSCTALPLLLQASDLPSFAPLHTGLWRHTERGLFDREAPRSQLRRDVRSSRPYCRAQASRQCARLSWEGPQPKNDSLIITFSGTCAEPLAVALAVALSFTLSLTLSFTLALSVALTLPVTLPFAVARPNSRTLTGGGAREALRPRRGQRASHGWAGLLRRW
jgi:hypothetical protein